MPRRTCSRLRGVSVRWRTGPSLGCCRRRWCGPTSIRRSRWRPPRCSAASGYAGGFGDTAVPLAGPGAPLVAEFSIAEFAAAVGLSTEAGKRYVGHALELRYRLPRLWAKVTHA